MLFVCGPSAATGEECLLIDGQAVQSASSQGAAPAQARTAFFGAGDGHAAQVFTVHDDLRVSVRLRFDGLARWNPKCSPASRSCEPQPDVTRYVYQVRSPVTTRTRPRDQGIHPDPETMGGGTDLRLADAAPPPGPRLRNPPTPLRSHDPPRHDRPDGPPPHRKEHHLLAKPDTSTPKPHTGMKQQNETTSPNGRPAARDTAKPLRDVTYPSEAGFLSPSGRGPRPPGWRDRRYLRCGRRLRGRC